MDERIVVLSEKLAEKLGTTGEHLWGVLVQQAYISGGVRLTMLIVAAMVGISLFRFVVAKTTRPPKTTEDRYPKAEWDEDKAAIASVAILMYLLFVIVTAIISIPTIATAFINPQYWALSHFL